MHKCVLVGYSRHKKKTTFIGGMELVSLRCNRDITSASSYGLGRMGRRLFQKFVRAGRDGRPWRAAGMDFWNKRHGFLTPIVSEVCQSGPWGGPWMAGRDGLLGWTFETNGTDSSRRLFQKSVRAGRGGQAVDGRPWRAAGMNFWNKWHGFLAPIVSEVCQSEPWGQAVDGQPWRAAGNDFETNGTDSWRRLFQKSFRAGHGSGPWTSWQQHSWNTVYREQTNIHVVTVLATVYSSQIYIDHT